MHCLGKRHIAAKGSVHAAGVAADVTEAEAAAVHIPAAALGQNGAWSSIINARYCRGSVNSKVNHIPRGESVPLLE